VTGSNNPLFDAQDAALLEFLEPVRGRSGTAAIQPFRIYHSKHAQDTINNIIDGLERGRTAILDLGNANEVVMNYFSNALTQAVFNHQVEKFSNNRLGNKYVQLYFEEAHTLFPNRDDVENVYSRIAKEGAKYHIGMVYSTQSPTTVNKDLLTQTENFFIAHISSRDEVNTLARLNVAFESYKEDILTAKTVGYMRMLTRSNRFVVSVQANKFEPEAH
jgi:DNA helicase HerA-like ATPase